MPHKKTSAELQERGQILYRRKDYSKAVEAFSEAIESEPNLTVSLLDNRAAAYDKLGDVTAALKDAKSAIRLREKDSTGYLRAGKLLQKAGKPDVALGIYKLGMRKVVRNFDVLHRLHDALLRSTAPPTAADPFAQLPLELVEMVLAHLNFRQIVCCTRVSKQWNSFIASLPNLWSILDLSEAKKPVKNDFLSLCLNRSARNISAAYLKRLQGSEKAITAIVRHCKRLHTLSIVDGGVRSPDFIHQLYPARSLTTLKLGRDSPMSLDSVTVLLRELTNLKHIEIHSVMTNTYPATWIGEYPNLEVLILHASSSTGDYTLLTLQELIKRTPELRNLTISHFQSRSTARLDLKLHCPKLEIFDMKTCDLVRLGAPPFVLPPTLRIFRTSTGIPSLSRTLAAMLTNGYMSNLPSLQELEIGDPLVASILLDNKKILDFLPEDDRESWMANADNSDIFNTEVDCLSHLHTLSLNVKGDGEFVPNLLSCPRLMTLQNLRLTGTYVIDDSCAQQIARNFPDLQYLDLSATAITGFGVKQIVNGCQKLRHLRLVACERCGGDAIEWARTKGLSVDFAMNPVTKGNGSDRKVIRYDSY